MKHIKSYLGLVGLIGLVLVVAEGIFVVRNKPEYATEWVSAMVVGHIDEQWQLGDAGALLDSLKVTQRGLAVVTPEVDGLPHPELDADINQIGEILVGTVDLSRYKLLPKGEHSYREMLAMRYYLGAILADERSEELAAFLLPTAVRLAPHWGPLHVELANMYAVAGEARLAGDVLDACVGYPEAADHCRYFGYLGERDAVVDKVEYCLAHAGESEEYCQYALRSTRDGSAYESVGFLRDEIVSAWEMK